MSHLLVPVYHDIRGWLESLTTDPHSCRCEVRHVALRRLLYRADLPSEDEELVKRVTRIKTNFGISKDEQDDLFRAAKLLVSELEASKLLPDATTKTDCGPKHGQFKP